MDHWITAAALGLLAGFVIGGIATLYLTDRLR